jgi:hypothetical protein
MHITRLWHIWGNGERGDIIMLGATRFASKFLNLQILAEKRYAPSDMVVDRAWEEMPIVNIGKGKDAPTTLMDANFWKGVTLRIKVFDSLVSLLHLVDGNIKPSLAWLYGELLMAILR